MKIEHKYSVEDYRWAMWQYLLEHSEVTDGGALFVKFHTKNSKQFFGHVEARIASYHWEDVELKESKRLQNENKHTHIKLSKKNKYESEKAERRAVADKIHKAIREVEEFNKLPRWKKQIVKLCRHTRQYFMRKEIV